MIHGQKMRMVRVDAFGGFEEGDGSAGDDDGEDDAGRRRVGRTWRLKSTLILNLFSQSN